MELIKFTRTFLFLAYLIYMAQGQLYPTGHLISKVSLISIFGISLYYLAKLSLSKRRKNSFFFWWSCLLALNVIGFILTGDYSNPHHIAMMRSILLCSLPFYPFFYFASVGVLNNNHFIYFLILFLPIAIIGYYFNASEILLARTKSNENIVNNAGYTFVFLIPYIFLITKRRLFSIIVLLVLLFFIIESSKRGAIMAGFGGLIIYIYYLLNTVDKKDKWKGYLISILAISVIIYYGYDLYSQNEFLQHRMEQTLEGNSSGRDVVFSKIINAWYNNSSSFFNLLFGFGFAASLEITGGLFAHNDVLELLSNFGLIGLMIYFLLLLSLCKMILAKNIDKNKKIILLSIFLIWILSAATARWYISIDGFIHAALLGYLIGSNNDFQKLMKKSSEYY